MLSVAFSKPFDLTRLSKHCSNWDAHHYPCLRLPLLHRYLISSMSSRSSSIDSFSTSNESGGSMNNGQLHRSSQPTRPLYQIQQLGIYENLKTPLGFCLGVNNTVLVVDTENHRVVVFDLKLGCMTFSFGGYGTGDGMFVEPRKVCVCVDKQFWFD